MKNKTKTPAQIEVERQVQEVAKAVSDAYAEGYRDGSRAAFAQAASSFRSSTDVIASAMERLAEADS